MHFKKNIYIKGIHIKLMWKNDILRAKIYNYNQSSRFVFYQNSKVLTNNLSNIKEKNELKKYSLSKKPLIITQEMSHNDLINKDYYLNLHITDEQSNDIMLDEQNISMIEYMKLLFK